MSSRFVKRLKHKLSDFGKVAKLKEQATFAAESKLNRRNMRRWAKEWGRKPPRWTSFTFYHDPKPLKLLEVFYRDKGFATRVRKAKSDRFYLDIFGWNSWCKETGEPKKLTKAMSEKKLKKVC